MTVERLERVEMSTVESDHARGRVLVDDGASGAVFVKVDDLFHFGLGRADDTDLLRA